jgi:hypothetical protein
MRILIIIKCNWMVWACLACFLLIGCKDESIPANPQTSNQAQHFLVGEWDWLETVSLNRLDQSIRVTNPQTEDKSVRYVFYKNNRLSVFDGDHVEDYYFSIELNTGKFDSTFWLVMRSVVDHLEEREAFQIDKDGSLVFYHLSVSISRRFERITSK